MGDIGRKRLFLLDMDGTIYLDNDLFPGTKPFLDWVRKKGGRYLFLTNNSSRSAAAYVEKLGRLGRSGSHPSAGYRMEQIHHCYHDWPVGSQGSHLL